jgi:PEP-CTERM motif
MKTMKIILSVTSALAVLAMATLPAKANTYLGTGNVNGSAAADGGAIGSVVVNNDASTISFTINSTQPMASWIFYAIEIQHIGQAGLGDTGLVNPWGEHVGISTGENALINTWGTGATPGTYGSVVWTMGAGASYAAGGTGNTFATMTVPLSSLGLSVGDSFYFDVVSSYASPGGQSAYGALDNTGWPAETDNSYQPWLGSNYYDSATDAGGTTFGTSATMYTVVPEPATLALLSGGVILLMVLRRNRARQ